MIVDPHIRKPGDIFAADMEQMAQIGKIAAEFKNSTVFLTGGTGFLGKMFLEKLLRISKTVRVLVLVRPKKGKDTSTRFQEIFDGPNMVPLKLKNPNFGEQVRLINGDCANKDLGLSDEDKQMLIEEVNYVIHCAATVRFDQELRTAARINVRAVMDLIAIAKQMKNLRAFLHVSTAYSNCPREVIDEEFYEPAMKGEDLLHMVDAMSQERLTAITPSLIKDWPNTYVFTKTIAEDVIKREAGRLPIAILRPSIVVSSKSEPVAGWIDNMYGVTGCFVAGGMGLLRCLMVRRDYKADLVPADYVTNAGFAVIWDLANRRSLNDHIEFPSEKKEEEVPIYNVVSSSESPITWRMYEELAYKEGVRIPLRIQIWYPFFIWVKSRQVYTVLCFLLHTLPAYVVDGICYVLGKEQRMVKGYQKIAKFMEVVIYFGTREWQFSNKNLQDLWRKLEPKDQRVFPFSMRDFDWSSYMHYNVRGVRVYLLKDPLETVPAGRLKYKKLMIAHWTLVSVLAVIIFALFNYILKLFM